LFVGVDNAEKVIAFDLDGCSCTACSAAVLLREGGVVEERLGFPKVFGRSDRVCARYKRTEEERCAKN